MAEILTRGDLVGVYLTGASSDGGRQHDPALSLGGYRSAARVSSRACQRRGAIRDLVIERVGGWGEAGACLLESINGTGLRLTWLGGSAGTTVEILQGERKLIEGASGEFLVVRRGTVAAVLSGSETLHIVPVHGNGIGLRDVTAEEAAAGIVLYGAVMLRNEGAAAIGLSLSSAADYGIRIATETPGAGGNIQTIANETTAPTGVTWGDPFVAPVTVASLAAGGKIGLWIERTTDVGAAASAHEIVAVDIEITSGVDTFDNRIEGAYRIAGTPQWEVFRGVDADPDVSGAPWHTSTERPYELPALDPGHDYRFREGYRNEYGLLEIDQDISHVRIGLDGGLEAEPPSAPTQLSASALSTGGVRVTAQYDATQDEVSDQADSWCVWASVGADPDPDNEEPAAVFDLAVITVGAVALGEFRGPEYLYGDLDGPYVDAADVRIAVRMRREVSEGVYVYSASATTTVSALRHGPRRVVGRAFVGMNAGLTTVTPGPDASDIYWVDEAKSIRLVPGLGSVSFYAGTGLVWRAIYDSGDTAKNGLYIPSDWDIWKDETLAGAGTGPVEVASWDPSAREMYIAPYSGVRRMKLEATAKVLTYVSLDRTASPTSSTVAGPVNSRYDAVCFQVYDTATKTWVSYMSVDNAGLWLCSLDIDQRYTQAQVEAL